jgi:hypothetical protein
MPDSGEDHGESKAIGGGDYVVVFYGAAGLDDSRCTGCGDGFKTVWEGEEGV